MNTLSNHISDTWCSLGWNHQFIGPDGNVKPCCRYVGHLTNQKIGNSINNPFHSDFMDDLRKDMLEGRRNKGCLKCWQEEDAGKGMSIRQNYNRDFDLLGDLNHDIDIDNPEIKWLELSFNNRCNIRCRMCGPYFSTNWYKDWAAVKEYVPGLSDLGTASSPEDIEKYVLENPEPKTINTDILDEVLPNIRHIKMTGGEPFIMPEYMEILEKLVAMGRADKVYLNYSTNLTVMPKKRLIELWKHFKAVEFATSFDGVGKVIEYQRHPSKWETVEKVTRKLFEIPNGRVGTRPTITIYNILDVPNITEYWAQLYDEFTEDGFNEKVWINHTHAAMPQYLSLTVLPDWAKQIVKERLEWQAPNLRQQKSWDHLVSYMYSEDNSHLLPKFVDFTKKLDERRGEDFREVVPEFARLLD